MYETLLDGLELQELNDNEGVPVKHYLMIDAHFTWWEKGRSYLCRIFDMLHMGYIDEVLFGREVMERLPVLVEEWTNLATKRGVRSELKASIYRPVKTKPVGRRVKEQAAQETLFNLAPESADTGPANAPAE